MKSGAVPSEIDAFDLLLAKTRQRRPDRGIVLHRLRGVGKTVLLNEFRRQAEHAEFMVVSLEGRDAEGGPEAVRAKLARNLLQAGRKLNRRGAGARLLAALGSIASFSAKLGVTGIDIGVNLNHGRADSGSIEVDLEELIEERWRSAGGEPVGPDLHHRRNAGSGRRANHSTPKCPAPGKPARMAFLHRRGRTAQPALGPK